MTETTNELVAIPIDQLETLARDLMKGRDPRIEDLERARLLIDVAGRQNPADERILRLREDLARTMLGRIGTLEGKVVTLGRGQLLGAALSLLSIAVALVAYFFPRH